LHAPIASVSQALIASMVEQNFPPVPAIEDPVVTGAGRTETGRHFSRIAPLSFTSRQA